MPHQIDVLLPFHRLDGLFVDAANSVLGSTGVKINLILIDDRPNDVQPLPRLNLNGHHVSYARTSGRVGYGRALEIGSKLIESDRLALMNSDDLVVPDRFVTQVRSLESAELSITGLRRISITGKASKSIGGSQEFPEYDPLYLLFGSYGANATWAMTRKWWDKNFQFDSEPTLDWRIALESFSRTKISYNPEVKYLYRRHKAQHTRNSSPMENYELVCRSWNNFVNMNGLKNKSLDLFTFLAVPWRKGLLPDYFEIEESFRQVLEISYDKSPAVRAQIQRFIERRSLLGALRANGPVHIRTKLLKKSYKGLPRLISDIIGY